MKQEDKELLLKDLCARMSYNTKVRVLDEAGYEYICIIDGYLFGSFRINGFEYDVDEIMPYLRPMNSMIVPEEREECQAIVKECLSFLDTNVDVRYWHPFISSSIDFGLTSKVTDWLNAHHFDYRGLIEKGLALEAPDGMYELNK